MRNDTFDYWLGETSKHEAITPPRVPYEEKRKKPVLHDTKQKPESWRNTEQALPHSADA